DHDQLASQLYQLPNGLMYAANDTVSLLSANIAQETFRTLPPANHDEWTKIGQQLSTIRPIEAGDLQTMYAQFPGRQTIIKNATMSDLRFTKTGYRFILDLQPGFDLGGLAVDGVSKPGSYVITYDSAGKRYSAQPATSANAVVAPVPTSAEAHVRTPTTTTFRVENPGSIDLDEQPVIITAQSGNRKPVVVDEKAVALLAGEPVDIDGNWQPSRSGKWTVTATVYLPDGREVQRSETVNVQKAYNPPWQEVVRGAWPHTSAPLYLGLLVGLVTIPLASGLLLVRRER
ncbi:MAG TPA: hypothetical protein VHA53_11890, partial [Nitrolancea sp.]|nr:hypothetical protein [Nitrolancea sp.]